MPARVVRDLVREHDLLGPVGETAVEQCVPDDDPPGRAEPGRVGICVARVAAHLLDPERDLVDSLLSLVLAAGAHELGVVQRLGRDQVRAGEREQRRDADERRRARDPPPLAQPAGQRHHDQERQRDGEERRAELGPVADEPLDVPDLDGVVPSLPPHRHEPERQPDEPDDAEPEHPEQHPGADPARRRLLHEPDTASRVHPQHQQEHHLREQPVEHEEPLVAAGVADELRAEGGVDVDARQGEPLGHGVVQQQPGRDDPDTHCRDQRCEAERLQAGSPRASGPGPEARSSVSCSGFSSPRRNGAEYG